MATPDYSVAFDLLGDPHITIVWSDSIAGRIQDSNNFYFAEIGYDGTQIYKKVNGTITPLGSSFASPTDGQRNQWLFSGTDIQVSYDGVLEQDVDDSDISGAGMAGFGFGSWANSYSVVESGQTNW